MYIRCIYFLTHSKHFLTLNEKQNSNWCLGHSSHLGNSEENVYKPKRLMSHHEIHNFVKDSAFQS